MRAPRLATRARASKATATFGEVSAPLTSGTSLFVGSRRSDRRLPNRSFADPFGRGHSSGRQDYVYPSAMSNHVAHPHRRRGLGLRLEARGGVAEEGWTRFLANPRRRGRRQRARAARRRRDGGVGEDFLLLHPLPAGGPFTLTFDQVLAAKGQTTASIRKAAWRPSSCSRR